MKFTLCVYEMKKMVAPCFFVLDHYHYARWMCMFLIWKCSRKQILKYTTTSENMGFSSMRLNDRPEQNNKNLKGDGETFGVI